MASLDLPCVIEFPPGFARKVMAEAMAKVIERETLDFELSEAYTRASAEFQAGFRTGTEAFRQIFVEACREISSGIEANVFAGEIAKNMADKAGQSE